MATRPKNQPVKKVGRPTYSQLTDLQREVKNKILLPIQPYFKPALEKLAEIGGVEKATVKSLEVAQDSVAKNNVVPPSVQKAALDSLVKMYTDAVKLVYGKDKEGTYSGGADSEDDDKDKPTATVSKLSLTVVDK